MDFEQKLKNYAELIVRHGLNVQPEQIVTLSMEAVHRDLGVLIAEQCYSSGARHVSLDLSDVRMSKLKVDKSDTAGLDFTPAALSAAHEEILSTHGAYLKIVGSENPDILTESDPEKVNRSRIARYTVLKEFYKEGIGKSKVHWSLAAAATPAWGQKIFPDLSATDACNALWEEIFRVCRVDQPDFLALWKEHNHTLQSRAAALTAKNIKNLHFTGPGTDLLVGLSDRAVFKGGGDISPLGVEFEPNLPTEECFSTPDWRKTEGTVRATRPVMVNGVMVHDLEMQFKAGELVHFSASAGKAAFEQYIESDEGARRLGEVALVGVDSPIFQSGLIYHEILFDENAACHIAIGSAYKFCIAEHEALTAEEFEAIGCNESSVHTDIMISSEHISVTAETYSGEQISLLTNGAWAI